VIARLFPRIQSVFSTIKLEIVFNESALNIVSSFMEGQTINSVILIAFLIVYCARPNDWTGLWAFPFAKITAGIAILGLLAALFTGGRKFLHFPKEVILLFLLFGQLCLSVPFSIWPGGSFETVFSEFSKVIPIVILIVATSITVGRLKVLLIVQTGSVALIALLTLLGISQQMGLSNVSNILRSGGAVGGIYGNPNDFAWALALMFPIAFALMLCSRNFLVRCFWLSAMALMVIALMRTYSRGGMISFFASAGMAIWFFGVRSRRTYLLVTAVAAGVLLLALAAPVGFFGRLSSTTDWAQDATGSAWARKHLFMLSLKTTMENPLFGIGPGNFVIVSGTWHGTHNTYTQFSSEAGIPSLLLFVLILWSAFRNLNSVRKWTSTNDELWILSAGLSASLAGLTVGGFFGMAAYHFFSYFMVGYSCALYKLALIARDEGDPAKLELKNAKMTQRRLRREEPKPTGVPDYSRQMKRSGRSSVAPLPQRLRFGG